MSAPIEQQGGLLNSEALQRALLGLGGPGGGLDSINLLLETSNWQDTIFPVGMDGITDNWAVVQAFVGPRGSLYTTDRVKGIVPYGGQLLVGQLLDLHPSISLNWLARGGIIWVPGNNLPGATSNLNGLSYGAGAEAAVIRVMRASPPSPATLAYSPDLGGFNIDFRGSTQRKAVFTINTALNTINANGHGFSNGWIVFPSGRPLSGLSTSLNPGKDYYVVNAATNSFQLANSAGGSAITLSVAGSGVQTMYVHVDGARVPNPDPSINLIDGDPLFDSKKDYSSGLWHDGDVIGAQGYGLRTEPGNGRANLTNLRLLNSMLDGVSFGSNDKTLGGHGAAGGNGQSGKGYGMRFGQATGAFAVTQNVWGCDDATIRNSANAGGVAMIACAYFALATNNFNEACKFVGGANYNNAGVFAANQYHPHANLFVSDGVAGDALSEGLSSLQSHNAITEYQGLALVANSYVRTDSNKGAFTTNGNFGGTTDGTQGTAFQTLVDVTDGGGTVTMVNSFDTICSAPDVKPWTSLPQTITLVASGSGGALTLTCTGHNLQPNDNVGFYVSGGAAPTGITTNTVVYWVQTPTNNTITLYTAPVADFSATPIPFVDAGTGTLTMYNLSSEPYAQNHGNVLQWAYMDCYRALFRVGALTPKSDSTNLPALPLMGWHSHIALGIAETDNANAAYAVEIGDRTPDPISGATWRNIIYGNTEFDNAPAMSWKSWRRLSGNATLTGGSTTIKAYEAFAFFQIAAAGIATYSITLPTGMRTSYRLTMIFKGGQITANTWTATLNAGSPGLPLTIGGWCVIELEWLADNAEWNVLSVFPSTGWTTSATLTGAVASDLSQADSFFIGPITGNITISNPTNPIDQKLYTWYVTQDAVGGHTISLGGKFVRSALTTTVDTTLSTATMISAKYSLKNDKYYISGFQTKMS